MATGTIKTKTEKGFGFISVQGSDDVFFHSSSTGGMYDSMNIGQEVEFTMEQGPKGPRAVNVVLAGSSPASKKNAEADIDADADLSMAA
ncbi:MAG: cold shock domain-containing protein [Candidatus Peregrinibacteria bacterium]